jgi:zinc D-Ala-D-Ala carboxypeptidase
MRTIMRRLVPGLAGLVIAATSAGLLPAAAASAAPVAGQHRPAAAAAEHQAERLKWAEHRSWPVLRAGARGERVYTLQYLLKARGYRLTADGRFGAATSRAVRNFQKVRHLVADGVVGGMTWARLVRAVRLGSKGDAVRAVQRSLRFAYHYKVAVDGAFGKATKAAVRAFQKRHKLVADGIVGIRTWMELLRHEK